MDTFHWFTESTMELSLDVWAFIKSSIIMQYSTALISKNERSGQIEIA